MQEQKNADDEMLTFLGHKYEISGADLADIRSKWVSLRNAAVRKATEQSIKSIDNIVNDYAEKRGVGQRG